MKEYVFDYQAGIIKGLREYDTNSMDNKSLTVSRGLFPFNTKVLTTHPDVNCLDMSFLGCEFPYPQLFVTNLFIIVCTETAIFECIGLNPSSFNVLHSTGKLTGHGGKYLISANDLRMKMVNLTPGVLWTLVDFQSYVALSNGNETIKRDTSTGLYSRTTDIPKGSCICATEGQVLVGGVGATQNIYNIDAIGFTCFESEVQSSSTIGGTHA